MPRRLSGRAPGGLFDLAHVEGLEGDLPLDQLLLEDLVEGSQPVLGGRGEDQFGVRELDGRVGALEVEPGGGFPVGLVDRVADFLHVDFGDDVEGGHAETVLPHQAISFRPAGRCPSGQREQTVNLPRKLRRFKSFPAHRRRGPEVARTVRPQPPPGARRPWQVPAGPTGPRAGPAVESAWFDAGDPPDLIPSRPFVTMKLRNDCGGGRPFAGGPAAPEGAADRTNRTILPAHERRPDRQQSRN